MAPPLKLSTVNRSLVRIPGSGSGGGNLRPMALNLARTLTDSYESLPASDVVLGGTLRVELLTSFRENLPVVRLRQFGESSPNPPGHGNSEPSTTKSQKPKGPLLQTRKRALVFDKESRPKKRACPSEEEESDAAAASENQAVQVSGANCIPDAQSARSELLGNASLGLADGAGRLKTVKPQSVIYQLAKALKDMQRKQGEVEKEKMELQEEVVTLRNKVDTFRKIFQDTNRLKAVLQRLNITI